MMVDPILLLVIIVITFTLGIAVGAMVVEHAENLIEKQMDADRERVRAEVDASRWRDVLKASAEHTPSFGRSWPSDQEETESMPAYEHFATYRSPGSLFSNETTRRLPKRSVEAAVALAPSDAFCFELFDLAAEELDLGPEWTVIRNPLNKSLGRYYLGGKVFTLSEVLEWLREQGESEPERSPLYCNLRQYDDGMGILCRTGNWQPFTSNDQVVAPVAN